MKHKTLQISSVLLIEDSRSWQNIISRVITNVIPDIIAPRIIVDIVSTVNQAKKYLEEKVYDIIILDGTLLDGNATDLFPTLLKKEITDKVIMITLDTSDWKDEAEVLSIPVIHKGDVSKKLAQLIHTKLAQT